MTHTFVIAGFTFSVASIVAAAAVVQWLIVLSLLRRRPLVVSSVILAIAWIGVFSTGHETRVAEAAVVKTGTHASCSSITEDTSAAEVKVKLGDPDAARSEEETRGPGAAVWVYRDSRCAVHILDGKVEFVD